MRLSDRYIGRQVLVGTLFAILLLSTILIMGSLFQNLRMLIVELGAPISIIGEFMLAAIPFSLIYTIPWAFLSAVLLVFGRLSSDNELTGFRVAGMSLPRLALPVFVIGFVLSALCLWLNLEVAPKAKQTSRFIATRAFFMNPKSVLSAAAEQDGLARFEEGLKSVKAYIEKSDGENMEGLHLFKARDPKDPRSVDIYVHAMKAQAVIDTEKKEFRLHLYDARFETTGRDGLPKIILAKESVPVVLPFTPRPEKSNPATMSIADIRSEIEVLKEKQRLVGEKVAELKLEVAEVKKEGEKAAPLLEEKQEALKKSQAINWTAFIPNYEGEIHRRYASSLACLAFAFIGIPLGIKARRKDTSTGLGLALLIGAAYFVCGMVGGKTTNGLMLAAWGPNVVCVLLGLYLLRRARFR
jgi:lipopolysaccharide export LptBFGC system permease protein LptF